MARTATGIGLIVLLVGAAIATAVFFLKPQPGLRYAGAAGKVSATVNLRLDGIAPPSTVTIDLGNGVQVVAARLP
jgi:hypothetical protein